MAVENKLRIGNLSLAAALITVGGELSDVEIDRNRQFYFHITGERLEQALALFHTGELQGSIPAFVSTQNHLRDLISGRRTFSAATEDQ